MDVINLLDKGGENFEPCPCLVVFSENMQPTISKKTPILLLFRLNNKMME